MRLVAVGDRQPSWVDAAFAAYVERMPRDWKFRLDAIPVAKRPKNKGSDRARNSESTRILAKLSAGELLVLLDERGRQMTSSALARELGKWQSDGDNLCFVIGGPDGVSPEVRDRADTIWSLSELTLPHGLARVLLAEQLYRAWSMLAGHPYHRA